MTASAVVGTVVGQTTHHTQVIAALPEVFVALAAWQRYLDVSGCANENTRKQYKRSMVAFFADVLADPDSDLRSPWGVTEDDVVASLAKMGGQGDGRNARLRALRSFYGWASGRYDITNPLGRIVPKKPKYGPAPSLAPEEMSRLLRAADACDPRAPWAIQLQYATACRVGSLLAVTPQDIRHGSTGRSILFSLAKGDKPYELPLEGKAAEAVDHLLELIDYHPKHGKRRPTLVGVGYESYRLWIKRAGELAGIEVNTHLMRHTRATRLAEANVDIRTITEVMNWADGSLLRRYAAASAPNVAAAMMVD
jgi:integrase